MYEDEKAFSDDVLRAEAAKEDQTIVLCAASAYNEKYYLNPAFEKLPESIRDELKIISVLFVEEIGGTFRMEFDEEGELRFTTEALPSDYSYDEIGAALMVKEIQRNKRDLLESLEMFYRVFFLGHTELLEQA